MRRATAPAPGSGFATSPTTRSGQSLADPNDAAEALRTRGAVAGIVPLPPQALPSACAVLALDAALWAAGVSKVEDLVRTGTAGRVLLAAAVRAACVYDVPFPPTMHPACQDDDWLEWFASAAEWSERCGLDGEAVLSGAGAILASAGEPFADVGALACDLALAWDLR
jgi:hypothetical protein